MIRIFIAALLGAAALASPASAQEVNWAPYDLPGGCRILVVADAPMPEGLGLAWAGACTPGALIEGFGEMTVTFEDSDGVAYAGVSAGNWVGGLPDGDFAVRTLEDGEIIAQETVTYRMGCLADGEGGECIPYSGQ